ncbi:MAG: class I SAM-dependent methyltransferase [Coleofasciculaceae cyanobacterium SM2_3_26]|nr:class I SAM-dependent methyltransferase [Coleofasciculaceae cyanobacterium SM2_3_26]
MSSNPAIPTTSASIFPGEVFANTEDFDAGIRCLLPHYDEMLETVARCLPETCDRILELGCGTGELTQKILQRCPQATAIAVDYSPRMLARARKKLVAAGLGNRVTWIEGDFGGWTQGELPAAEVWGKFDACASALAIHHLTDEVKAALFQKIRQCLKPGGCFWNADPVLPESDRLKQVYQAAREAWSAKQGTTLDEVRAKLGMTQPQGYSGSDRLVSLDTQMQMLCQAGFESLAVVWKYFGMAVVGGYVP